jgi:hypothetical protein
MRLSRELVAKRESFLRTLFEGSPTLTAKVANERLAAEFGKKMKLGRIYELRKDVAGAVKERAVIQAADTINHSS